LAFSVALWWCAIPQSSALAQSSVNFKAIPTLQPIKEIGPTPDFTLLNAEGKKVSLKDFRGKTVFLNFWATWCVPCREEMPALDRLQQKLGGPGFEVVALSIDTAGAAAVK